MDNNFDIKKSMLSTSAMLKIFAKAHNLEDKVENFQHLGDAEKRSVLQLLSFDAVATFGTLTGITNLAVCACLMGSSAESVLFRGDESRQHPLSQDEEDWVMAQMSRIFQEKDERSNQ